MKNLVTLQERFKVLYAAEGRDLRECYDVLKAEGFQTGQWLSFKGRYSKLREKKDLDAQHLLSRHIRESLQTVQNSVLEMAMTVFLRLRLQYQEKKNLSIEDVRDFINLAGAVLALSPQHPKYTQRNINTNANFELSDRLYVEIFYRAIKKVPEAKRIFEDPAINEKFLGEIQKMTEQVKKGQLLLESAPKAARGEAGDD